MKLLDKTSKKTLIQHDPIFNAIWIRKLEVLPKRNQIKIRHQGNCFFQTLIVAISLGEIDGIVQCNNLLVKFVNEN